MDTCAWELLAGRPHTPIPLLRVYDVAPLLAYARARWVCVRWRVSDDGERWKWLHCY